MSVPSRVPTMRKLNRISERITDSATFDTSNSIFILPKSLCAVSATALTKAAGIHDDVRDNGKRNSEAEDGDSRDDQNEAYRIKICRNERNEKHSEIGEITEQE